MAGTSGAEGFEAATGVELSLPGTVALADLRASSVCVVRVVCARTIVRGLDESGLLRRGEDVEGEPERGVLGKAGDDAGVAAVPGAPAEPEFAVAEPGAEPGEFADPPSSASAMPGL